MIKIILGCILGVIATVAIELLCIWALILKEESSMKSIKEKAEEYSFIKEGIDPSGIQYRDFNINKQEGFEAGANYVLDVIEEFIEHNLVYEGNLKRLIEQLKK